MTSYFAIYIAKVAHGHLVDRHGSGRSPGQQEGEREHGKWAVGAGSARTLRVQAHATPRVHSIPTVTRNMSVFLKGLECADAPEPPSS